MTLSTIISIAISLTLIYLVLSIVTSELQEIIANLFNLRAKNLQQSIIRLLGEHQEHSNLFTTLVNDIFGTKKDTNKFPITRKIYEHYLTPHLTISKEANTQSTEIDYVQSHQFAHGLISVVKEVLDCENKLSGTENESTHYAHLQQVIDNIQTAPLPDKLKKDFTYLLKRSQTELTKTEKELRSLEQEVQDWFNKSMEYSSEIYRQKAKIISFILGVILVLIFNIDTINIVDKLSKSEVLVSEFNSLAIEVIESNSDFSSCPHTNDEVTIKNCIKDIQDRLNIAANSIDNLPIGWNLSAPFKEQFNPLNIPNVFNAIIGWLISAIAISLGAPFWFAVLRNLMNFKSSQTNQGNQTNKTERVTA